MNACRRAEPVIPVPSQSSAQYRSEGSRKRGLRPTEKVNQHKIAKMVLNSVLNAKIAHTLLDATTRHQGNGVQHAAGGSVHRVHGSEHRGRRGAPGGPGRLGSSRRHLPTAAGHARAAGEAGRRGGRAPGSPGAPAQAGEGAARQRRPAQLPPGCPRPSGAGPNPSQVVSIYVPPSQDRYNNPWHQPWQPR